MRSGSASHGEVPECPGLAKPRARLRVAGLARGSPPVFCPARGDDRVTAGATARSGSDSLRSASRGRDGSGLAWPAAIHREPSATGQALTEGLAVRVLGVNAVFHDPAAALVVDGRVVAAAEEERFSRRKHGKRPVPFSAWELPELAAALVPATRPGCAPADLDAVAYSFDPAPGPRRRRASGLDDPWDHLRDDYARAGARVPRRGAARPRPGGVRFVPHHVAHAASAAPRRAVPATPACWCSTAAARRVSHLAGRYRGGRARGARRPGAAALARPALRGAHRAPRLPALQRRVQGDGAGLLRRAALPRRAAGAGPRHRRRRLPRRAASTGRRCAKRRGAGRRAGPRTTPTSRPACRRGWRRCCSTWPAGCTSGPATASLTHGRRRRAQLRGERRIAARGPVRARCGCSRPPATRAPRSGAALHVAARAGRRGAAPMTGARPGPRLDRRRARGRGCDGAGVPYERPARPRRGGRRRCWPATASSPGSRAAASTARARSATGRCSPTRAARRTSSG